MSSTIDTISQQTAARAEASRVAEHQTALTSLRRLGQQLAPPDPVLVIDMRVAQLVEVFNREWQEFDTMAAVQFAESAAALRDARAASVVVYGERA